MMVDIILMLEFWVAATISILVISNPASTSAIFIALTTSMSRKERLRTARRSVRFSAAILLMFALSGFLFFQVFGFSVAAFRIMGGIMLLTIGASMINPRKAKDQTVEDRESIALIPLSIPFTAGPGTIVTVTLLMSDAMARRETEGILVAGGYALGVFIGIGVCITASFMVMKYSERIDSLLKEDGRRVMTRLMGLIVMAIAVQFMINGALALVPDFREAWDEAGEIVMSAL